MLTRLSLAIVASIALGQPAGASQITYDFAGTLDSPINGTNQFTGSFTINGDPTVSGNPASVTESGSDVSLTVKMGGQAFNFVNQLSPVTSVASFDAGLSPAWIMYPFGPPQDEAVIFGATQSGNPTVSFGMSFYSPAAVDQLGNLRDFSFFPGSSSIYTTFNLGSTGSFASEGTITSIELVPTPAPEPSTLGVFAVLGFAAMAHRRRRRSRVFVGSANADHPRAIVEEEGPQ